MFKFNSSTSELLNICWGCLKMQEDVHQMTADELKSYQTCVAKFSNESLVIFVCNLCAHLLKKFNNFVQQCQIAYDILSEAKKEDETLEFYTKIQMKNVYDLRISNVQVVEFANVNNVDEEDDMFDHNIYVDDDEIPLVMLKTEQATMGTLVKKKKRKRRHSIKHGEAKENEDLVKIENNISNFDTVHNNDTDDTNREVKYEISDIEVNIKEEKRGEQKALREGFTSRMVQETYEYTVIKLSKEQVLKEMEEKLRSDEYLRSLYKCEKCAKGFNFEDVLKSHMEKHAVKKGWLLCDLCEQYCPTIVSLRGHMKSHTTRYKCKVCGCVRLSRQVLLEHHSNCHTSSTIKYTCQQCDFCTSKRTSMQRHVRTRHHKTEKHPCEQCGKTLNSLEALRVHTTRHDKSKRVKCDECDRWFVYPSLLHQHKMAVHVRDDYYCVECDVKFKSRENLSLHFKRNKRHRDVSTFRFECEHCSKRFMFVSALWSHLASAHGEGNGDSLRANPHNKRHQLTCTTCHESFNRKSALRAHLKTHANERPFVCECGATFAQQATLTAHELAKNHKKGGVTTNLEAQVSEPQNNET